MSQDNGTIDVATLRFEGARFQHHALDVECTQELIAYRNLIRECAKELWRRKYPNRVRLPKGFEDGFRLQFDRVVEGSAAIPLCRVREGEQGPLDWGSLDEFDEAAELVDIAIAAASEDRPLPEKFPSNVVLLFRDLGKTLREGEILFTKARHSKMESRYDGVARKRLSEWFDPSYEDRIEVVGEVRMVNVGQGAFSMQLEGSGNSVQGRFTAEQEDVVLDALKNHRTARLRVRGVGEFGMRDRMLQRFARIDQVAMPSGEATFDSNAIPIWEQLASLGRAAPAGTWDNVPTDLSTRIDEAIYGSKDDTK